MLTIIAFTGCNEYNNRQTTDDTDYGNDTNNDEDRKSEKVTFTAHMFE